MRKKLTTLLLLALLFNYIKAEIKVAQIFSSNMVMQKGLENPVWGWADKGEKITVEFASKTLKTTTDKNGKWRVKLPALDYGGPYTLTIKGKNKIKFENILIGEVWVCSGQSNMEFTMDKVNNSKIEIEQANYPELRMFTVPKKISQNPIENLESGTWEVCTPDNVPHFSAVGYFFALNLLKDLKVPIGMIHTSWGGTVAESWTSSQTIATDPDFSSLLSELKRFDLKKMETEKKEKILNLLGGQWPVKDEGLIDGKAVYAAEDYNDDNWKNFPVPKFWEDEGYDDLDGIAWFRFSVNLETNQVKQAAEIHLGTIDDEDMTWINGQRIGETQGYNIERIYKIKDGILKPGKNIIAVRVKDNAVKGGFSGNPDNMYLKAGNLKINLAGSWKVKFTHVTFSTGIQPNSYPTLLYNGMINPIVPYGIKGTIWYQGEANADRALQYRRILPNLIKDWRQQWGLGDFPFIWVQLANYKQVQENPIRSSWAELREAQTMTLKLPNTGMALAIDIGEANDIHPKNKQDVGKRLELNALKLAYSKNVVYSGPMFESMKIDGNNIIIQFKETGNGLVVKDRYGYLKAFTVAGDDKIFHWAKGKIVDSKTVIISSDEVKNPVAIRFGWADNPDDLNLYNTEGLPAVPFRTDDWEK